MSSTDRFLELKLWISCDTVELGDGKLRMAL
jgi:hypothetical protein